MRPTRDEVYSYAREISYGKPEKFFSTYERKHWEIGGKPIDWKAKMREWQTQDGAKRSNSPKPNPAFVQNTNNHRSCSYDEWTDEDWNKLYTDPLDAHIGMLERLVAKENNEADRIKLEQLYLKRGERL